jgi:hypothetical protein
MIYDLRLPRSAPKKIDFAAGSKDGSKYWNNRDLRTNLYESPFSSTYPPRSGFATRNDMFMIWVGPLRRELLSAFIGVDLRFTIASVRPRPDGRIMIRPYGPPSSGPPHLPLRAPFVQQLKR